MLGFYFLLLNGMPSCLDIAVVMFKDLTFVEDGNPTLVEHEGHELYGSPSFKS